MRREVRGTANRLANFDDANLRRSARAAVGPPAVPDVFPEVDVAGRLASDPAGTLSGDLVLKAGVGVQTGTGNRWGDYSTMNVDPRDGCTFWYQNQFQSVTYAAVERQLAETVDEIRVCAAVRAQTRDLGL